MIKIFILFGAIDGNDRADGMGEILAESSADDTNWVWRTMPLCIVIERNEIEQWWLILCLHEDVLRLL